MVFGAIAGIAYLIYLVSDRCVRTKRFREREYMSDVIFGIRNYGDIFEQYMPPRVGQDERGRPLNSWRMHVAPCVRSTGLSFFRDEHWNSSWNRPAAQLPLAPFVWSEASLNTRVFGVTGPGTAFDSCSRHKIPDLPKNLVVLIEVRDSNCHWMAPGDWTFNERTSWGTELNAETWQDLSAPKTRWVAFADGAVWLLKDEVPFDVLTQFLTVDRAKDANREESLSGYRIDVGRGRAFHSR